MTSQEFFVSVAVDIPVRVCFTYKSDYPVEVGQRVLVPFGQRKVVGWVTGYAEDEGKYDYKKILKIYDEHSLIPSHLIELAREVSEICFSSMGNVLSVFSGKLLLKKIEYEFPPFKKPSPKKIDKNTIAHNALRKIADTGGKPIFVRFYDISEKVKFFQDIAESSDGSVVFVFPTLTQAEKNFQLLQKTCGERVIYFKSEAKKGETTLCWLKMLKLKNLIIVGTRIALFSPVSDMKMLIVDEPSDYGHKERRSPRYNSREIALKISEMRKMPVIFTTIQPDLTDIFLCRKEKAFLVESTTSCVQPQVIISKFEKNWQSTILTDFSKHLLEKTLVQGKKAILIHNIKGYARLVLCKKCGASIVCQNCGNILIPISDDYAFCGTEKKFFKIPSKCPVCKRGNLRTRQPGIKKIVDILRNVYSEFNIIVFSENQSIDTSSQVIVGTQQVISRIVDIAPSLVIFINADMMAARSAFRSEEKFFLIVEKIKKMMPGSENIIVIQTVNPGIDIYGDLVRNDADMFYRRELSIREKLKFPPYGELISIKFSGRNWLKNKDSVLEGLKEFGEIYEAGVTRKTTEILWKVSERKKSFESLEKVLKKYRITNFSVDPTPYF